MSRRATARLSALVAASLFAWVGLSPAFAAPLLERRVVIEVSADGHLEESVHLRALMATDDDLDAWSSFSIRLDENRRLLDVEARIVSPDGERRKIRRREQDRADASGGAIFHSSQSFHVLEPESLRVGEIFEVSYSVAEEPYFPGGTLPLRLGSDPVKSLDLRIRRPPEMAGWRWHLDGPREGLTIEESADGVRIYGQLGETDDLPDLAAGSALRPVLRFAWAPHRTWSDVGRWYSDLLADVPRASPETRRMADELLGDDTDPWSVLERLTAFTRRQVRYVAVEVGIGGYRPSTPEEVLARRWGDCKDKSLLLIDLLQHRGIEAHPALVRLDHGRRIDADFPSPYGFNHLIVAVPVASLDAASFDGEVDDLPVAEGFLFIDPTQSLGGVAYLHGAVRGQDALIVLEGHGAGGGESETGPRGRLVSMPPLHPAESSRIVLDLEIDPQGHARGQITWRLEGDPAATMLRVEAADAAQDLESRLRGALEALYPGARITQVEWSGDDDAVPYFEIRAGGTLRSFVQPRAEGARYGGSLPLPDFVLTPAPNVVEELGELSGRVGSGSLESVLRLRLPPIFCPAREKEQRVENEVGTFDLAITSSAGAHSEADAGTRVEVTREVLLRRSWIEPEHQGALHELALAEHRANRRRVRLRCP